MVDGGWYALWVVVFKGKRRSADLAGPRFCGPHSASFHWASGGKPERGNPSPPTSSCRSSFGAQGNMAVGQNQWYHVGVGEFTTHFSRDFSGWAGMFTGTVWLLTHGHEGRKRGWQTGAIQAPPPFGGWEVHQRFRSEFGYGPGGGRKFAGAPESGGPDAGRWAWNFSQAIHLEPWEWLGGRCVFLLFVFLKDRLT